MSESIFLQEGERFLATELARGPWDPQALHGGAPAALIADAFERHEPAPDTAIARLGFEFLRPIPFAPLVLSIRTIRAGRRVQELSAELHAELGDDAPMLICRATALRVTRVPGQLPELPDGSIAEQAMPGPDQGQAVRFSLSDSQETSFAASAMEMRWLDDPTAMGPGRVWMRLRHPLIPERPLSGLARLAATADFGNGVSASLSFAEYLFVNADLTIHLQRAPRGEWIGIDARTLLHEGGTGLAESVLHDLDGPVGRGFQAIVVAPRSPQAA
jgi:Thioesterase-like superfamily